MVQAEGINLIKFSEGAMTPACVPQTRSQYMAGDCRAESYCLFDCDFSVQLGANAILAVSLAVCKAGAGVLKTPLYQVCCLSKLLGEQRDFILLLLQWFHMKTICPG